MTLDCNTPAGQLAIAQQHEALRAACRYFNAQVAITDDTSSASVDAVLIMDGCVSAVVEVKCRMLTVQTLEQFGSLLITEQKLVDLRQAARLLCAEGFVFAYLTRDAVVAYWKICDDAGVRTLEYETKTTATKATVNGGEALRLNAFLPYNQARFFPVAHERRAT
ncbi:MAG: hypothetical protein ACO3EH_00385 [Ilumatobacteraceae bacterium]